MTGGRARSRGTQVARVASVTETFLHLASDVRYALRSLRHAPLFTAVAVLSIAFGIGANTAVFTLVDQVVLRRLPVQHAEALVQVSAPDTESYGGGMGDGTELSYAMYRDLRDHNTVFAGMFCRLPTALHVGYGGRTEQVAGELVSGTFFPLLGVQPAVGRLFTADDERAIGGHPVAVLGFDYWKSRFSGDPAVVGRTIVVNGHPLEIVGVVEAGFQGIDIGSPSQVYVPIAMQPQMGPAWLQLEGRRFRWVQVFARLRDGVTAEQAQAGMQPLYRSLLEQEAKRRGVRRRASADTKRRFLAGGLTVDDASRGHSGLRTSVTEPLLILMAVAGGVLLIVCANVANLLIARGAARQRELALRLAVGASRRQIVRLLLVESLVLAVAGARPWPRARRAGAPTCCSGTSRRPRRPIARHADPDARILLFTCALARGHGARWPASCPPFRSTRVDVAPALKGAGGAVVGEQPRLRKTLVVAQVALSFLLLIGAGLFVRSLNNLLAVDPGFRTDADADVQLRLSRRAATTPSARARSRKTLLDAVSRTPGRVVGGLRVPVAARGRRLGHGIHRRGLSAAAGRDAGFDVQRRQPGILQDDGDSAARRPRVRPSATTAASPPEGWPYRVAVVNQTFAKRYFKGGNPIGRHIGIGGNPGTPMPIEIVGLVEGLASTPAIREDAAPRSSSPICRPGSRA